MIEGRIIRRLALAAVTTAAVLALAGCAPGQPDASPRGQQGAVENAADLSVAKSPLGDIVVDSDGMTVYVFDEDQAGAQSSACTGDCAALWPAVTTTAESPELDDITGTVGTITGTAGGIQLTLNGLPLYTFLLDARAGDLTGQGFDDRWWALSPNGDKITEPAPPASPRGY